MTVTGKHVASPAILLVRKTGKRGLSPQVYSFSEWKKNTGAEESNKPISLQTLSAINKSVM